MTKRPDVPERVYMLFAHFTLLAIKAGFRRYSSDAILHRIRWHEAVEYGDREFKCNDHWTSHLSRWFMAEHPEHQGFFETRALRAEVPCPY